MSLHQFMHSHTMYHFQARPSELAAILAQRPYRHTSGFCVKSNAAVLASSWTATLVAELAIRDTSDHLIQYGTWFVLHLWQVCGDDLGGGLWCSMLPLRILPDRAGSGGRQSGSTWRTMSRRTTSSHCRGWGMVVGWWLERQQLEWEVWLVVESVMELGIKLMPNLWDVRRDSNVSKEAWEQREPVWSLHFNIFRQALNLIKSRTGPMWWLRQPTPCFHALECMRPCQESSFLVEAAVIKSGAGRHPMPLPTHSRQPIAGALWRTCIHGRTGWMNILSRGVWCEIIFRIDEIQMVSILSD